MTTTKRVALSFLKQADLKHLAFLTGLHSTGTKSSLITTLKHELPKSRVAEVTAGSGTTPKLLSIDMGIRNLAYCVLELHTSTDSLRQHTHHAALPCSDWPGTDAARNILPHLRLTAWHRLVVNEPSPSPFPSPTSTSAISTPTASTTPPGYDPITYATLAYKLISSLLLTHKPTTIIIERQRWRSGGASSVLEWTIRVNMFEGMICAVLETLRREWEIQRGRGSAGRGSSDREVMELEQFPEVYSVSPKRVFDFWSGSNGAAGAAGVGEDDGNDKKGKEVSLKSSKAQKLLKIGIVEGWLRGHAMNEADGFKALDCTDDAATVRDAFLDKLSKQKGRTRAKSDGIAANVEKIDDLADCLLQGITWVQWEANRNAVLPLLDLSEDQMSPQKEVVKRVKPSRTRKKH